MSLGDRFKNWLRANVENRYVGNTLAWLGLLYWPFDEKLPLREAIYKAWRRPLSGKVGWLHVFGGVGLFLLILLVATGVLLSFHYEPNPETGRDSVMYITTEVPAGWLIRGVHQWAGQLLVALVLVHVARVFFGRTYRAPRQATWLTGVLILPVVLSFQFTGDTLPWDQTSYWTAVRSNELAAEIPLLGSVLSHVTTGPDLSSVSIGRAFALHVVLLPWLLFFLLAYHLRLVRRHGIAPPLYRSSPRETADLSVVVVLRTGVAPDEIGAVEEQLRRSGADARVMRGKEKVLLHADRCTRPLIDTLALNPIIDELVPISPGARGTAFFPHHVFRIVSAMLLMAGVLILLAAFFPPRLAGPHDPFQRPEPVRARWYFAWFEELMDILPDSLGFVAPLVFVALPLVAILWPLLDPHDARGPRRPWLVPLVGTLALIAFGLLTLRGVIA